MNILSRIVPTGGLHIVATCERIKNVDRNGRPTHFPLPTSHVDRVSYHLGHDNIGPHVLLLLVTGIKSHW